MNPKNWEYPTGWPEQPATRQDLEASLIEQMLTWDGRAAYYDPLGSPRVLGRRAKSRKEARSRSPTNLKLFEEAASRYGEMVRKLRPLTVKLILRDGINCHWCKRPCSLVQRANSRLFPTRDHVIRLADGGKHALDNLVLACAECNHGRHAHNWRPCTGSTSS